MPLSAKSILLVLVALFCGMTTSITTIAADSSQPRVAIVYGEADTYREAVSTLRKELERNQVRILDLKMPSDSSTHQALAQQLRDFQPTAIASGGSVATQFAHKVLPDVPLTYFMVPNPLDLELRSNGVRQISGTSSDIDPAEQCEWIHKTAPQARRIAILYSSRTEATANSYSKLARSQGLEIVKIRSTRDEFMSSIDALTAAKVDGVLMLPDSAIYSRQTIQRLLVWGVREKKPIWTFSPKLVKAGAYASMHSDVPAVGVITAQRVLKQVHQQSVGSSFDYAPKAHYAVNLRTAELIGNSDGVKRLDRNIVRYGDKE
jgi:ABC-type uncharacterized transport system substrate-binding protein